MAQATKIRPLGNRVLVRRSKAVKTKGGILLPDAAQEKPKEGEVIAVGPGKTLESGKTETMVVKINDRILFSSYAGTAVQDVEGEDEEYLIMSEEDIIGILK